MTHKSVILEIEACQISATTHSIRMFRRLHRRGCNKEINSIMMDDATPHDRNILLLIPLPD